jgi:cytochrome c peroxidase
MVPSLPPIMNQPSFFCAISAYFIVPIRFFAHGELTVAGAQCSEKQAFTRPSTMRHSAEPHAPTSTQRVEIRTMNRHCAFHRLALIGVGLIVLALNGCVGSPDAGMPASSDLERNFSQPERLGKLIFHDTNLSEPLGTSCASCHNPERAFGGNHGSTNGVALGSQAGAFGFRNTPSVMYGSFAPAFSIVSSADGNTPTGGQFLDGRVDTQAEQAKLPLLSANEMNNPSKAAVVSKVAASSYAADFRAAYGDDIFSRVDNAFDAIAIALDAYQHTAEFHPFSSRFDDYLRGNDTFTATERRGMSLFFNSQKGNCVACHAANQSDPDPTQSLFTDFTYDNLGVPRNSAIPANADPTFFDLGLGGPKRALPNGDPAFNGAFKVPTLRNVALKEAFMHNGVFVHLADVVAFYVTRDTDPDRWYPVGAKFNDLPNAFHTNVNTSEIPYDRHLGETPRLNTQEIADLTAFLRTLTDSQFVGMLPISN